MTIVSPGRLLSRIVKEVVDTVAALYFTDNALADGYYTDDAQANPLQSED